MKREGAKEEHPLKNDGAQRELVLLRVEDGKKRPRKAAISTRLLRRRGTQRWLRRRSWIQDRTDVPEDRTCDCTDGGAPVLLI